MARQQLRSHLSGSVPVSIVVHVVVLLVLLVIPVVGDIIPPIPLLAIPTYMLAAPLPPPPAVLPPPTPSRRAAVPTGAPTTPPDRILAEPPPAPPAGPINAVPGGVPLGVGEDAGTLSTDVPAPPPPPPPPPAAPTVRAAQLPEQPRKLVDARPVYPEVARSARIEGTVILEAVLDTSGRVTELRVLRSVPMLDQAALDAVRQWRYSPTIYYGRRVSVLMTITVRFTLQP